MAVNWGSIAGQLASIGLPNLAKEAVQHGADAEARRREDIRRQEEQARLLAEASRRTQPPAATPSPRAATPSMTEFGNQLRQLSPEELEFAWKLLVPAALTERVARGEVSAERAKALSEIMADFERARALPDLEDRTIEMNKVMARMNAIYSPERK